MKTILLKGGSLSSTYHCTTIGEEFVRKTIDRAVNREYGFVRWYSQLKKLQRYNTQYPNLFPKVLRSGVSNDEPYFDLEYLDGFQDIKTILTEQTLSEYQIAAMSEAVWKGFNQLHSVKHKSNLYTGGLYYKEEVEQKLNDALKFDSFKQFYDAGTYSLGTEIVHGMNNYLHELENFFNELRLEEEENIHGNPTLENIMYSFKENRIVFIDVYEESIIDTKYLDYAQVLQCSRSHYGIINDNRVYIDDFHLYTEVHDTHNFELFNQHFTSKLPEDKKQLIDILEATQFIRMLPFKLLAGETDKAKYFYVHACKLFARAL
jgi:hypothetical protein